MLEVCAWRPCPSPLDDLQVCTVDRCPSNLCLSWHCRGIPEWVDLSKCHLQTPVTSSPIVAGFLSNLPAYRIGVDPLLRGVEIGLVHGLLVTGTLLATLRDCWYGSLPWKKAAMRSPLLCDLCSECNTTLRLYIIGGPSNCSAKHCRERASHR